MRLTTIRKYKAIQIRYKQLYHEQSIRSDKSIEIIMDEFYIAQSTTVYRILNTTLPDEVIYKDPNQLELDFPE
jgi:hypothetical protein